MPRIQIRLTEEQSQAVKRLASERRISVAELIRLGVEDLLRQSSTLTRAAMKRRALAAAGRFRSGEKDLAARHDVSFWRRSTANDGLDGLAACGLGVSLTVHRGETIIIKENYI
jgi:hypothetical protein